MIKNITNSTIITNSSQTDYLFVLFLLMFIIVIFSCLVCCYILKLLLIIINNFNNNVFKYIYIIIFGSVLSPTLTSKIDTYIP